MPRDTTHQPWSPKQAPRWRQSSPRVSTKPSGKLTKEKVPNHQNGGHTAEEEDLREAVVEMEVEEATRCQAHQGVHPTEETQFPPGPTCPLTYDPSPAPTMRSQWENSPTSLTEIEPRLRHSSTNQNTTSYLTIP